MPVGIKEAWNQVRLLFSGAAASFRKGLENSTLIQAAAGHPLGKRLLTDAAFRSAVTLYVSLVLNFASGALQLLVGVCSRPVWLGALAAYHILLAVMQLRLSGCMNGRSGSRNKLAELRQYRRCGIMLMFMTPVFASILILIVHRNSRAEYPGFLIYFAAVFAFVKIGTAVSGAVRFQGSGSPALPAAKTLRLIAAMISVLTLETAILSRYGSMENPAFYQGVLGTAGGAVCVFTLGSALSMILHGTRRLKVEQAAGSGPCHF